jgi:hypothetical protein
LHAAISDINLYFAVEITPEATLELMVETPTALSYNANAMVLF